jgi:phosphoribosylformylglycinamidine synthase
VVGGIGLIENLDHVATLKGAKAGDVLYMLATHCPDAERHTWLGASLYMRELHGAPAGVSPRVKLDEEIRNAAIIRELIHAGAVSAVHDLSEGGLAIGAAEMALASGVGVTFVGGPDAFRQDELLFGEVQSRYLFAAPPAKQAVVDAIIGRATTTHGEIFARLGAFGGDEIVCKPAGIALPLATLRAAHEGWLPNYMKGQG